MTAQGRRTPPNLPATTKRVHEFIVAFMEENDGLSPTIREIGDATDISSTSVVSYHLGKLERAGVIWRRNDNISRGIVVVGAQWIPPREVLHVDGQ